MSYQIIIASFAGAGGGILTMFHASLFVVMYVALKFITVNIYQHKLVFFLVLNAPVEAQHFRPSVGSNASDK